MEDKKETVKTVDVEVNLLNGGISSFTDVMGYRVAEGVFSIYTKEGEVTIFPLITIQFISITTN